MSSGAPQLDFKLTASSNQPTLPGEVLERLKPAVPSQVYETYWRFAAERQRIFHSRLRHRPPPWTDDTILQRYKFTNVYRASDRVSQFLIRHVIYNGPQEPDELFFRIMLFKFFNKIETWQLLERQFGEVIWRDYSFSGYDAVLSRAFHRGESIYSAAYIMPSPGGFGHRRKHRNHLRLLESLMSAEVPERLQGCERMQDAFLLLRSFPSVGDFLAYQFITDLNYSTLVDFSESEFVVPGPGALNGIRKCFRSLGGLNEIDAIKLMVDVQSVEFEQFALPFDDLWGRPLQYIDCQNLFCEVDKYARVAHPGVEDLSGRTRIKQTFRRTGPLPTPWFPPKWDINERVLENLER